MWQPCMTKRALAATRLTKAFNIKLDETWKSISNCSMSLKGEKCSMVVGVGRGVVLYHKKRLSIF